MTFRILALFSLFLVTASAQTKKGDGKIQVRLLAEVAPPALGKVYLAAKDTRSEGVELPTSHLSEPLLVSERVLALKTEGKEISLCNIALPATGSSFAVILVTARPAGFQPIVVRTDDPTFKAGDVFFINRSNRTVLCKLGESPLALKPGESVKSRPTGAIDNTYYNIAFATREPDGDKILSSTRWPIDEHLRSYLIFFTDARGRTSYRAIDEPMPAPKS